MANPSDVHDSADDFIRINPRNRRAPAHLLPEVHLQCIADLQVSHAGLSAQVLQLRDAMREMDQRLTTLSSSTLTQADDACADRTIIFARMRALSALTTGSPELSKRPGSISAFNSVVQVMLKSCATDCTMREFQILAMRIERQSSIRSNNCPSDYSVTFPSPSCTSRLRICFDSYGDICRALEFNSHQSTAGVYREKSDQHRSLRAIQVLGVDMQIEDDRKILLGQSFPSHIPSYPVPYLHQSRAVWQEGSWETGFSFCLERLPAIGPPRDIQKTRRPDVSIHNITDLNFASPERYQFSLAWERAPGAPSAYSTTSAVPGLLRSYFPAVIVRSRQLLTSTRIQFETNFRGQLPSHLVVAENRHQET